MSHKRSPIIIALVIVLLIISVAGYFYWRNNRAVQADKLTASGTIEVDSTSISAELSGRVAAIYADEGDYVNAGDILFELDGTVLKAQLGQASATLDSARAAVDTARANEKSVKAQYDLTLQAILTEDVLLRVENWNQDEPAEFDQPVWYFTRSEELINAQKQIDSARTELEAKQTRLDDLMERLGGSTFLALEQELLEARRQFLIADKVLEQAEDATSSYELREAAQTLYDDAEDRLDDAQDAYDDELKTDDAEDILTARAEMMIAQETYDTALDYARSLQTGPSSLQLAAAQANLDQAQAALNQAETAVKQAEASLQLLDTQISLLKISSPVNGVVLTRMIESGEVISAGYAALQVGDLDNLTLTVYVPENRIGEVVLGMAASVQVDSFPGEKFDATIIHIADQAEFTPRNVQTVEGRQNTVFAVKLRVLDENTRLKPGMPADVTFE